MASAGNTGMGRVKSPTVVCLSKCPIALRSPQCG
jgi:hypothetical protein